MRFLLVGFISLTISTAMAEPAQIAGAADHWDRLQRMVHMGAITPEAAQREKVNTAYVKSAKARNAAQRSLASITPELQPQQVRRFKAPVLEVDQE